MDDQQTKCPTCGGSCSKHQLEMGGECNDCLMAVVTEQENQRALKNNAVLEQVKAMVSDSVYKFIEYDLAESSWTYDFAIVENHSVVGEPQCDDDPIEHGHRVVNQTTNGGMSGDEYAGDVFIPISPDNFFKYSYSM